MATYARTVRTSLKNHKEENTLKIIIEGEPKEIAATFKFKNSENLIFLLKKAQLDSEALKADIEAIKNFKIDISQN